MRTHTHRFVSACAALLAILATPHLAAQPDEVPFITSPDNVTLEMLRIASVGPGDHVIDLGSGDGRIVILAARRFGASGVGVEIVPDLVARSRRSAQEAGVADKAVFMEQDLFTVDLQGASVVTMYLLPEVNLQLRPSLLALRPGTRIVSHDWNMADWKPDRTVVVPVPDKKVGLEKSSRIHLWVVPAGVAGVWCGTGAVQGANIALSQQFQAFEGTLTQGEQNRPLAGRIEGYLLKTPEGEGFAGAFQMEGDTLRTVAAVGRPGLPQGSMFKRAASGRCG
jgi:SAM-dependent methyltransferase